MARYVVDVMPKREILDPQGKAVLGALPRLGFEGVTDVRQGKRFEVEVDGEADDDRLADVRRMAETLLANPVIEDFAVTADEPEPLEPVEGRRMRIGVVTFPGSLDDVDAARAVRLAGGEAVALWHGDADLQGVDAVDPARRLLVRRLPALRRDLALRAGDDRGRRGGRPRGCRCSASATASRSSASPTCCPGR